MPEQPDRDDGTAAVAAAWASILESDDRFISRHHLDSYDAFVQNGLRRTVSKFNPITIVHEDTGLDAKMFMGGQDGKNIVVHPPVALPRACRDDDLTYACDVTLDVHIQFEVHMDGGKVSILEQLLKDVRLMRLPVMLHSSLCRLSGKTAAERQELGECRFDKGGYFIVDGAEKVVVAQTRNANNRLFVVPLDCSVQKYRAFSHRGWIRSASTDTAAAIAPKTIEFFRYLSSGAVCVKLPALSKPIPLFLLFRALGVESDLDIMQHVLHGSVMGIDEVLVEELRPCVLDAQEAQSQETALAALKGLTLTGNHAFYVTSGHEYDEVLSILRKDVFPTAGDDLSLKAHYLGLAAEKFMKTTMGAMLPENRDHMRHQRVDASGMLFADSFRDAYTMFVANVKAKVEAAYLYGFVKNTKEFLKLINQSNRHTIFDHSIISDRFTRSLKGKWMRGVPIDGKSTFMEGVAQELNRVTYMNTISSLRRVSTPVDASIKLAAPRKLQASQWGYLCPCETPDGEHVGVVNHMAMACRITYPDADLDALVERALLARPGVHPLKGLAPASCAGRTRLFLNDVWIAVCDQPVVLMAYMLSKRRQGELDAAVSMAWRVVDGEVQVHTDGGRCIRPLLVAESDVVEYLDPEESETAMIAMYPRDVRARRTTHVEIHPSLILSVVASNIPLAEHNPSPRNVFACAQAKQGVGLYATNFRKRFDKAAFVLHYPQRNLVTTRASRFLHLEELGYGQNLIVAISSLGGYNAEDAVIINQSAVQRGLLDATYFKTVVSHESEGNDGTSTTIRVSFDKVDPFPIEGAALTQGDMLMARSEERTTHYRDAQWDQDASTTESVDKSIRVDKTMAGTIVDRVYSQRQRDGMQTCKIRLRQPRPPTLGDKLGSRHGQKGVVGAMVRAENMPFTREGLVPDVIINPHGMPSRMTVGHLMETLIGKACCAGGFLVDGTPFQECDAEAFSEVLQTRYGYERFGNEVLQDGRTGLQMEANVFVGPCYYQRFKHMVADKVNFRRRGGYIAVTRQPTHGRSHGGGLKLGEMEANAIMAHGAMAFFKESFVERSDGALLGVNAGGGLVAPRQTGVEGRVIVPYAVKLFTQELHALGIKTAIIRDDFVPQDDNDGEDSDVHDSDDEQEEAQHALCQRIMRRV